MITRAHAHNFRVIALNRRDYVGSTQFSQEELSRINSKDPNELREFLKDRGREILLFLNWIVDHKAIPRAKEGGKGGLALLGWSLGNVTTLSMLAFLNEYEKELVGRVEPWLTTFFIYGKLLLSHDYDFILFYLSSTTMDAQRSDRRVLDILFLKVAITLYEIRLFQPPRVCSASGHGSPPIMSIHTTRILPHHLPLSQVRFPSRRPSESYRASKRVHQR